MQVTGEHVFEPTPYPTFQAEKHIPNLDGLRGISILLVMIHHIPPVRAEFLKNFQYNSRIGVYLFFAISGFLITRLALRELAITGTFNIKNFYIRRSLRLFPLYYTVLAAVCLMVFVFNVYPQEIKQQFAEKLPSYLFYYSNLAGPIGGPFSLLWSLAVEEQFYLFFSLVFLFFPKWVSFTTFATLAGLQATMPLWTPLFNDNFTLLMAIGLPGPIFLGVCFAYCVDNPIFYSYFSRLFSNPSCLATLGILLMLYLYFNGETFPIPDWTLYTLTALLVVACGISPSLSIIDGPFLSYVGKISYGIYLMHTIVFYGVKKYVSDSSLVVLLIGGALTIWIASLSYEHYEKFFLKLKNKFST